MSYKPLPSGIDDLKKGCKQDKLFIKNKEIGGGFICEKVCKN